MRIVSVFIVSLSLFSLGSYACAEVSGSIARAQKKGLEVNLKDPTFTDGVLTTDKGGVVTAEGLRIQAQKIIFINRIENGLPVKKIIAEDNLLLEFSSKAFVGDKLEFDFLTNTGTLCNGKTYFDVWFIGGEKIELRADGSYHIDSAFITTSANNEALWDIRAGNVCVTQKDFLSASNIRFRITNIPIMWLPSFKANLRLFKDPPVRYKIIWDKGLGPRATMRYRIYSWRDFNLYFRLDYRLKRGFGGAIETDYRTPDLRTVFVTKSYVAHDKTVPDETGQKRYRFQGLWDTCTQNGKTKVHMSYDKLHDPQMPGDFKSEEFEINTQKQTIFWLHHQEKHAFATLRFQPRINNFQSLNQELPTLLLGIKPFSIGNTGIISQNIAKAAFLDYVFADNLSPLLPSRHAMRIETKNQLYRPFKLGPVSITPNAGIVAIFYNNNPNNRSAGQGAVTYGGNINTHLYRGYGSTMHQVTPYLRYEGISEPLSNSDDVIIFDIDDGYHKLNLLRFGFRNSFYTVGFEPCLALDFFAYTFFDGKSIHERIPKGYASMSWKKNTYAIYSGAAWNFQENLLDYFNIRTLWTLSEDFAFGLEFRHRSKYDWRKANHHNFIVDATRSLSELLNSPLSDGRNTFLTHFYANLSPRWACHFQSHHGWGRKKNQSYNAAKIELFTLLTTSWQLRVSFEHTPNNNRFGAGVALIK